MTAAVRFDRFGDQYVIRFSFDPTIVALIKTIPVYARSWNPDMKVWRISDVYVEQLAADMSRLGYLITGLEPTDRDDADWARILFRRVGPNRLARSSDRCHASCIPTPRPAMPNSNSS